MDIGQKRQHKLGYRYGTMIKISWWYNALWYVIETHSTSWTLCEGNPLVTGGFPSQMPSNAEFWCFQNRLQLNSLCSVDTTSCHGFSNVNSLMPSDAYMRQWNRPSLVQIMACSLLGAKPLSEPTLVLLSIGTYGTNFSEILIEIQTLSFWKMAAQKDNSLRPSDAIWRHRFGSTLAQVMACCLTAPSHYLN